MFRSYPRNFDEQWAKVRMLGSSRRIFCKHEKLFDGKRKTVDSHFFAWSEVQDSGTFSGLFDDFWVIGSSAASGECENYCQSRRTRTDFRFTVPVSILKTWLTSVLKLCFHSRNLKELSVKRVVTDYFDSAFTKCRRLERLEIWKYNGEVPLPAMNAIKTCINCNKRLKTLVLGCKILFNDEFLSTISSKLTDFKLFPSNYSDQPPWTLQLRGNLNLFLISQSDTLEVLKISEWMGHDVMRTILSMPNLKKLTLGMDGVNYSGIGNWQKNHSVTDLYLLEGFFCVANNPSCYEPFFKAFRKVESLRIEKLTDTLANRIPKTYPFLKKLTVRNFYANHVSNKAFYLNLAEFNCFFKPYSYQSNQLFESLRGRVINYAGYFYTPLT